MLIVIYKDISTLIRQLKICIFTNYLSSDVPINVRRVSGFIYPTEDANCYDLDTKWRVNKEELFKKLSWENREVNTS